MAAVLILFVVAMAGVFLLLVFLLLKTNRDIFRPIRYSERWTRPVHADYAEWNRQVSFFSGKNRLTGYLYGEQNPRGLLIFSHGMGVPSDYYIPEILYFAERGYRVFAFDDTGYWKNPGTFRGLSQAVKDLDCAIRFADDGTMPITLFGHSMGGYASCAVLKMTEARIQNVVAVAGFSEIEEVIREYSERSMKHGVGIFTKALWVLQQMIFGQLARISAVDGINSSDAGALIIHGSEDRDIRPDKAAILAKRDQITNPGVRYLLWEEEGFRSHKGVLRKEGTKSETNPKLLGEVERFIGS